MAGAFVVCKELSEYACAPTVTIRSKVGPWDSLMARIVISLAQCKFIRDAVRFGIAARSAAVMTPGRCAKTLSYSFYPLSWPSRVCHQIKLSLITDIIESKILSKSTYRLISDTPLSRHRQPKSYKLLLNYPSLLEQASLLLYVVH